MDTLASMKVFARVAERKGFAAAARDLDMSAAAVTKHVASLENRVGARLLDRTTRHVALTEPGRVYLERCLECLRALDDADASVRGLVRAPRGTLRVTAPVDLQEVLPAAVARFLEAHRAVTVDLRLSNRPVDLVEDGFDIAVRIGSPSLEGDLVARVLTPISVVFLAAPAWLAKHGHPKRPEDLREHPALVFVEPRPRLEWTFERGARKKTVVLNPVLSSNSGTALLTAAAEGVGVAMAPSFLARSFVASGALERILVEWKVVPDLKLYAVYPHRRFLSPNVTAFIDALRGQFGDGKRDPFAMG